MVLLDWLFTVLSLMTKFQALLELSYFYYTAFSSTVVCLF